MILRSIVDPSFVASVVADSYGLEVTDCVLLRSLVNDVYRVTTPGGRRAFKLYRAGHLSAGWEVSLAAHVGAGVAQGVPMADGSPAGSLPAPEGPRAFSLWEWVPGAKPLPPRTDSLYQRFGEATAAFHEASAGFIGAAAFDPLTLVDDVLTRVPSAADRALITSLSAEAGRRLADTDLERGICHGDVTLDNIHVDGDRIIFFDLDRASVNWRATDLVPVSGTPQWPAFLDGYRSVRPFPEADVQALRWLSILLHLDYLHFHLYAKPAIRGTESLSEGWVDQNLEALRTVRR